MIDLAIIDGLLHRERWQPSSAGRSVLVAKISIEEAHALKGEGTEARATVEEWLLLRSRDPRPVKDLLMFVFGDDQTVLGFMEVVLDARGFTWDADVRRSR